MQDVTKPCSLKIHLESFLSDQLEGATREKFSKHFDVCPECQAAADLLIGCFEQQSAISFRTQHDHLSCRDSSLTTVSLGEREMADISEVDENHFEFSCDAPMGAAISRLNDVDAVIPDSAHAFEAGQSSQAIGPYQLGRKLGEGGFGIVYFAEQMFPLRRTVALKVIKPGMDTREVSARFASERQALAMMDHPNISRVFDAGITEKGLPYFVMEFVDGLPVTKYCDQYRLDLRDRLRLFCSICEGIQHAHQKGIVHRDLKPSNILVRNNDGKHDAKVIDFGIAKALNPLSGSRTTVTLPGQLIGTTLYMSPEQAMTGGLDVDTRTDVYSLGVLLFELLTGTTPLAPGEMGKIGIFEFSHMIREFEPPKPSQRLRSLPRSTEDGIHRSPYKSRNWFRTVCGDLDWIVLKALEKDRERRYESVASLAMDVKRYVDGDPVQASPPTARYRIRKYAWRYRWQVGTLSAVFFSLSFGACISFWQATIANQERRRADVIARDAISKAELAIQERRRADSKARLAESVVDKFYMEFAEKLGEGGIGTTALKSEFLLAAADFYAEIVEGDEESFEIRLKEAEAHRRAGVLYAQIGNDQKAEASFERCTRLCDRLGLAATESEKLITLQAKALTDYGEFLISRQRVVDAESKLRIAILTLSTLLADGCSDRDVLFSNARAHYQLAQAVRIIGNWDTPARASFFVISEVEKLLQDSPDNESYQSLLAATHLGIARIPLISGTNKDRDVFFEKALQLSATLVKNHPAHPGHRFLQARTQFAVADCHRSLRRLHRRREEFFTSSVKELWKLSLEFPDNVEYLAELTYAQVRQVTRMQQPEHQIQVLSNLVNHLLAVRESNFPAYEANSNLAFAYNHLSLAYLNSGLYEQASAVSTEALQLWEQVVSLQPSDPWWCREREASAYMTRSVAKMRCGDHRGALNDRVFAIPLEAAIAPRTRVPDRHFTREPLLVFNSRIFSDSYLTDRFRFASIADNFLSIEAYEQFLLVNTKKSREYDNAKMHLRFAYSLQSELLLMAAQHSAALGYLRKTCDLSFEDFSRSSGRGGDIPAWQTLMLTIARHGEPARYLSNNLESARVYHQLFSLKPGDSWCEPGTTRYQAAISAISAVFDFDPRIEDHEQALWRYQAHFWLSEELQDWQRTLLRNPAQRPAVIRGLRQILHDARFDRVRDLTFVSLLPEHEKEVWLKLWSDINDYLVRIESEG